MHVLRYLACCVVAGAVVGRGFGAFARASFHYPVRLSEVSAARRALLGALDVVEWPGLFALTLLAALLLWRWLRPASRPPAPRNTLRVHAATLAACAVVACLVVVPPTRPEGRALAGAAAVALAAVATALIGRLRAEARALGGRFPRRFAAQVPVATGHLAVTVAASLSLGFRGENALVHVMVVLVGIALFVAELGLCLLTAALTGRRRA